MIFVRQAQIPNTVPFEGGWKLVLSAENPQSITRGPGSAAASFSGVGSNDDQIPDFTAKVTFSGSWGFASLAGLLGAHLSYEHWWSDNLRSTLAGGYSVIDFPDRIHPGVSFVGLTESTASAHVNLMGVPASRVTLGTEYIFGDASFNGRGIDDDNTAHRVQAMAKWSF